MKQSMLILLTLVWMTLPLRATSYFMSPTGSDIANGLTTGTAWATPNHTGLNCGDTITAASGTYNQLEITAQPTCSKHDAVWVNCAIFDTCKISVTSDPEDNIQGAVSVRASNWAFTGWETTTSNVDFASCFSAIPTSTTVGIHDVYFINDVANGCVGGGFNSDNNTTLSVDYVVYIADVAWNASQGSKYCWSGFNVLQPQPYDTLPGTHIYFAQLFAWDNIEPAMCYSTPSTDGEGIIFDTFNGIYQNFPAYNQQAVIDNVLMIYNGAAGIGELGSGNSSAYITISNSTSAYNFIDPNQNTALCGQIQSVGFAPTTMGNQNRLTNIYNNLAVAPATTNGCKANPAYAYMVGNVDPTTAVYGNAGYSPVGQNIGTIGTITGFTPGPRNLFGVDPALANPVMPAAPNCTGKTSVIDCMSTVIANFTPTNSAFTSYGYHVPSSTPTYDPLFPQFLCNNPNMPTGLVTMGCLHASVKPGVTFSQGTKMQ